MIIQPISKAQAIRSLDANSEFAIRDDVIEWITAPISDTDIQAEISRLQAEYDANQYARDRAKAYPSLAEQADMAYWDRQNGTTTLDDAISAVKLQFPKG
jgi:hypothetical protein